MGDAKFVQVLMTDEEREQVNQLARANGYKAASEYIRALIEADSLETGLPLRFSQKWGGRRTPKAKAQKE